MPMRALAVLVTALVVLLAIGRAAAGPAPPFVLIVHSTNPYTSLEREYVAEAFLKKTTRWPNGDVIKPVDLVPDSPTRERFSQDVLRRSVPAVKSYWHQIIFAGR